MPACRVNIPFPWIIWAMKVKPCYPSTCEPGKVITGARILHDQGAPAHGDPGYPYNILSKSKYPKNPQGPSNGRVNAPVFRRNEGPKKTSQAFEGSGYFSKNEPWRNLSYLSMVVFVFFTNPTELGFASNALKRFQQYSPQMVVRLMVMNPMVPNEITLN